ncbi:FliG C-terminal domain-containing protein [Dechloromonas sp. ZS-1]|uniref:FliG C-terminal domain-containing protein n=1 Tax=Dechloromonas sp. ZS-1 TaxID=3138067 RepID=UPI0031FDA4EF
MFISDIKASQVHLSWHPGKETYVVTLTGKKDDLAQIELSPSALQSLIFQALAYMPHMEPSIVVKGEADAFRKQACVLKDLDDRSIQLLLREVQSDTLINFLWYMKNGDLIRLVLSNMSGRAAEMLLEDLEDTWGGKDPDQATAIHAEKGQRAIAEIMSIVERLISEGQLPDFLSHLVPPEEQPLTVEQVDALLQRSDAQTGDSHG